MALAVDAGGKVKASAKTGKINNSSNTNVGASALRDDLMRSSGVGDFTTRTDSGRGYGNTLANVLSEANSLTPRHSDEGNRTINVTPTYSHASNALPSFSSNQLSSSAVSSNPVSLGQKAKTNGTPSPSRSIPTIHMASMSSPQLASDNEYKKPDSWKSDDKNLHGEVIDDIPWFPGEESGPTRTNDTYERDMINNGMSMDYLDSVIREPNAVEAALDSSNELDPEWRKDLLNQLTTSIDDGTMDREHLLSDWMTGKQYYHYVHDLGMPGMPEDQIDVSDRSRYSKSQQQQLNGFQPYIPNSTYELGMSVPNIASATRTLHNYISNLRENGFLDDVDYRIMTDTGHGVKSFSGRDFDKMSNGYASQVQDLYDRAMMGDPDALSILTSAEGHLSPYTTMVRERELPDGSKHYGVVTERYDVNDLADEDVFNDLVWWDINDNTQATYPDENGVSTYGNVRLKLDNDYNILSGTLHTKDGFDLNIEPSQNGSFQIVTDDDAFNDWWNSHNSGNQYVAFSDGSSAIVSSKDIDKATKENPNSDWIKDNLVSYDSTSLKDIDGFDPDSLTVGNPTKLGDTFNRNKSEIGVMYVPDMVLSDGTPISRDAVLKIANDDNPDDYAEDGISYKFEPSGLSSKRLPLPLSIAPGLSNPILYNTDSRPRRLMHDSIIDEEGLHLGWPETFNWLADASANSIPISMPGLQWVDAFANALPYATGVESSSGDEYGRYQTTGYDIGSDENAIKFGTTIFGPKLENLAGYGHEPFLDPVIGDLIDKRFAEGTFSNLLLNKGWDSVGEAIEEVIGNYVDELGVYGLRNAWADPISRPYAGMGKVYDKDHNLLYDIGDDVSDEELSDIYANMKEADPTGQFPVLYDEHGREFRDPDTPIGRRFANAFAPTPENLRETANAAAGGGGVSMLYGMPELMYGAGKSLMSKRQKNENLSPDEWKVGSGSEGAGILDNEILMPESINSDRISSNDYRISPGAPIRFKE